VHSLDPAYAGLHDRTPPVLEDCGDRLARGIPVGADFPDDVVFDLSPDSGMQLTDSLPNTLLFHVVSERLKGAIEKTKQPAEFHRVSIRNHKKRIAREPYYVMNLLGSLDAMDRAKSDWRESKLVPGEADAILRLHLDTAKIPDGVPLFRLSVDPSVILVRLDLAREIYRGMECRGMIFLKLDLYGEERRPH
jgi:hypothetical protein